MKKLKGILTFFGAFLVYHLIGSSFFSVDENNVLQAPDWYPVLGIAIATGITVATTYKIKVPKRRTFSKKHPRVAAPDPLGTQRPLYAGGPDKLLNDAVLVFFETGQVSASIIERRLGVSWAQAASSMGKLEYLGIVSKAEGAKPRFLLVTKEQALRLLQTTSSTDSHIETQLDSSSDIWLNIDVMEGHQFEYWCAELLRKDGFENVQVTPGSGDQGVDILASKGGIKFAIQCKCYSSNLGNTPVQEVNAGRQYYHCQVGVVMTNSHFTKGAKELAEATGVLLWDRDKLQEFMQNASRPV